jgi:hypothetical protein
VKKKRRKTAVEAFKYPSRAGALLITRDERQGMTKGLVGGIVRVFVVKKQ